MTQYRTKLLFDIQLLLTYPGLVAGLVVSRLLLSMLEFNSAAVIIICYAGVGLNSSNTNSPFSSSPLARLFMQPHLGLFALLQDRLPLPLL